MTAQADPLPGERARLFALAYRMLGSVGEAEDVVQDAYLRWHSEPRSQVANPPAYLTTIVTHLCLDVLKSARHKNEQYPGVWLPEPMVTDDMAHLWQRHDVLGPEEDLERLQSVSLAFLAILEAMNPLERAVYLLAEVFDYSHAEIAEVLQRTPAACRQALRRSRQALSVRNRANAPAQRHRELLASFLSACRRGDVDGLAMLLAEDVESRGDGGGYVTAASKPVNGSRAVSRLFGGMSKQFPADIEIRYETVNSWPSALLTAAGVLLALLQIQVRNDKIERIDAVLNPVKLARVAAAFGLATAPTN